MLLLCYSIHFFHFNFLVYSAPLDNNINNDTNKELTPPAVQKVKLSMTIRMKTDKCPMMVQQVSNEVILVNSCHSNKVSGLE